MTITTFLPPLVAMATEQASPPTWMQMDADNDEDLYAVSKKMPLYVNSFSISMAINDMAVSHHLATTACCQIFVHPTRACTQFHLP